MTTQGNDSNPGNTGNTTVSGSVRGTGIAIGAGASATVATGSGGFAPELAAAVKTLRDRLATLDVPDDDTAERVALAESRLNRLEEAASAAGPDRDSGRIRKLLSGIVEAVGGIASLAGSVVALETAVSALLR
jgi:hypothetical protein